MAKRDCIKVLDDIILNTLPFQAILGYLSIPERSYNLNSHQCLRLISPNYRDGYALESGLFKIISELNIPEEGKCTVLCYASHTGSKDIVKALIQAGTDINAHTAKKETALHFASRRGHIKILELLTKNGAKLNIQNESGHSALILAAKNESGCLHALITAGASVNLQDYDGKTALHYACLYKVTENVKSLIRAGADVNIGNNVSALTLLLPNIEFMFEMPYIGRIDAYTRKEYNSPRYHCVVNKIAEILIDANINVQFKDMYGNTALHKAAMLPGNVYLIAKLIEAGADVNEQNDAGETALHYALMWNEREIIQGMKYMGVDKNTQMIANITLRDAALRPDSIIMRRINQILKIKRQEKEKKSMLHDNYSVCNIEVFESLLINRASVNTEDNIGHDPLWYMYSSQTVLNVFKLHNHFEAYRDVFGNTIFHLFINQCKSVSNSNIWSLIGKKSGKFSNYLTVQNIFGQTPLHIAANKNQKALGKIFSTFGEDLHGLLLRDEYGNTFLHTFLQAHISSESSHIENIDISFLKSLFENIYHNCSSETRTDLMKSTNGVGNTPLHLVFQTNLNSQYVSSIFEMFLNAGANINANNNLGETVLHCNVLYNKEQAKIAIANGCEVKVKNLFGESVFFSCPQIFVYGVLLDPDLEFLKVPGCDMSICDRLGRTMIMAHYKDVYIALGSLVEVFDKTTLDKLDDFGSNLLHYIAWEETTEDLFITSSVYLDIVPFSKLSVSKDILGQLPCDVAFLRGHSNILNQICVCKNGIHHQNLVFCHRRLRITSVIEKDEAFQNVIKDLSIHCSESKIRNLINVPLLGLVRFSNDENKFKQNMDRFEKAANDVKTVVVNVVNHICKILGEKDESLKNTVILSGSVAENTKIGLPDEFDFICLLDKMSGMLEMVECIKSAIKVKVKESHKRGRHKRFFDLKNHCLWNLIDRFYDIISEVLKEPDIYAHTNLFRIHDCLKTPTESPNFKIEFQWCCREYKNMTIKIDIVPAFEVYCPFNANVHSDRFNPAINHSGFVMALFTGRKSLNKSKRSLWEVPCSISASREEKHRLATLPSEARDAYVISKILCGKRMCPSVVNFELEETQYDSSIKETQCQKIISSYMLKNCLFYVAEEFQTKSLSVYGYVCKIFQKLLHFASEEKFPCYMFPGIDLFVYHDGERHAGACLTRAMYAKLILNIIGEHYNFDEIGKSAGGLYLYICENCEKIPRADGVIFKTCPRCKNGSYCSDECKESDFERHKKWCDFNYEQNLSETSLLYTRFGPIQNITDNDICAHCKKSQKEVGVVLKTCSRCKLWTYCSDECKESNFERHKPACDYHFKQNGSN